MSTEGCPMIKSKTDLSKFCTAVRKAIIAGGHAIKLASIRERIAESLSFNSVNHLLDNLPVTISDEFWEALPSSLQNKHDISLTPLPWAISYPSTFTFSTTEQETIINRLLKHHQLSYGPEVLGEFNLDSNPMKPDGEGGWIFKSKIHVLLEGIEGFVSRTVGAQASPGGVYTLYELHLQSIESGEEFYPNYKQHRKFCQTPKSSLFQLFKALGLDTETQITALNIVGASGEPDGFQEYDDDLNLYEEEKLHLLAHELTTEGLVFSSVIFGSEGPFLNLGFKQMFFLAESNGNQALESEFIIGRYLVTVAKQTQTQIPANECNRILNDIPNTQADKWEGLEASIFDMRSEIIDSRLVTEEVIQACMKGEGFTCTSVIDEDEDFDEMELRDLSIHVLESDEENTYIVQCLPMTEIITIGQEAAAGFNESTETFMQLIKDAGGRSQVKANQGDIHTDNISEGTVLGVIYDRGRELPYDKSVFGQCQGFLKPESVDTWLTEAGVVHLSANAYISVETGGWLYLSISGFDRFEKRVCVFGISFIGLEDQVTFSDWFKIFQGKLGRQVNINETYEFGYPFEENPNGEHAEPYMIPRAPSSMKGKLGIGMLALWGDGLERKPELTLPNRLYELIFSDNVQFDRDIRITPPIPVPKGEDPFKFLEDAIIYSGQPSLDSDERWEQFMEMFIEFFLPRSLGKTSALVSYIITDGGSTEMAELAMNSMKVKFREPKAWLSNDPTQAPKFNTTYTKSELSEIAGLMGLKNLKGINLIINEGLV